MTTVYAIYECRSFRRELVGVYSTEPLAESAKWKFEQRDIELGYKADYQIEPITMDEE